MNLPVILLVDDDSDSALTHGRALKASGISAEMKFASSVESAKQLATQDSPSVCILDLSLDDRRGPEGGYEVLKHLVATLPACRVIVLTGHRGEEFGVRAISLGAASFVEKPANVAHLSVLVADALKQSELHRAYLQLLKNGEDDLSAKLIGHSDAMKQLREEILRAASHTQSILLLGETGTGKGLCAVTIHQRSARRNREFVRYQAAFGSIDLINSDLFGHLKGAFTGAVSDKTGLIEYANEGTLFLDEVDELPPEVQVTLLGVLQEKTYRRVGATKENLANTRLISATNRDVASSVNEGRLRKDLYHRIAGTIVSIPPLRERREDIPSLCEKILREIRQRDNAHVYEISSVGQEKLGRHEWPGNVRELEAVVESAAHRAAFDGRGIVEERDLVLAQDNTRYPVQGGVSLHEKVEIFKKQVVRDALQRTEGNQVRAARDLGIDRTSLRRILTRS